MDVQSKLRSSFAFLSVLLIVAACQSSRQVHIAPATTVIATIAAPTYTTTPIPVIKYAAIEHDTPTQAFSLVPTLIIGQPYQVDNLVLSVKLIIPHLNPSHDANLKGTSLASASPTQELVKVDFIYTNVSAIPIVPGVSINSFATEGQLAVNSGYPPDVIDNTIVSGDSFKELQAVNTVPPHQSIKRSLYFAMDVPTAARWYFLISADTTWLESVSASTDWYLFVYQNSPN